MADAKPYTVIFYIDGDRALETFVERVFADSWPDAFDVAVRQARDHGGTSSGHSLSNREFANATEIITFAGHPDSATN